MQDGEQKKTFQRLSGIWKTEDGWIPGFWTTLFPIIVCVDGWAGLLCCLLTCACGFLPAAFWGSNLFRVSLVGREAQRVSRAHSEFGTLSGFDLVVLLFLEKT